MDRNQFTRELLTKTTKCAADCVRLARICKRSNARLSNFTDPCSGAEDGGRGPRSGQGAREVVLQQVFVRARCQLHELCVDAQQFAAECRDPQRQIVALLDDLTSVVRLASVDEGGEVLPAAYWKVVRTRRPVPCFLVAAALLVAGCGSASSGSAVKVASPPPTDPSPKGAPSGSPVPGIPVLGPYGAAVNAVGMSQYSSIYAWDSENPDGSVTIYVAPGSDAALLASLKRIDPAKTSDAPAPGTLPSINVVRVPLSISALEAQAQSVNSAKGSLAAAGYDLAGMTPAPEHGVVDVLFSSVPPGVTAASATSYVDSTVAPNLLVTTIDANPTTS